MKSSIDRSIVLVGMMGSGKSTVGKKLARKLNLQFYDSDKVLEEREGLTIVDIHEFMGKKYFQTREQEVIDEILSYGTVVLSTGGSSFMNRNIRDLIKSKAFSIWLDVEFDTIYERVSRRNTRPELMKSDTNKDKRELLEDMVKEMKPVLAEADIKIESNLEAHHLVSTIMKRIDEYLLKNENIT